MKEYSKPATHRRLEGGLFATRIVFKVNEYKKFLGWAVALIDSVKFPMWTQFGLDRPGPRPSRTQWVRVRAHYWSLAPMLNF